MGFYDFHLKPHWTQEENGVGKIMQFLAKQRFSDELVEKSHYFLKIKKIYPMLKIQLYNRLLVWKDSPLPLFYWESFHGVASIKQEFQKICIYAGKIQILSLFYHILNSENRLYLPSVCMPYRFYFHADVVFHQALHFLTHQL